MRKRRNPETRNDGLYRIPDHLFDRFFNGEVTLSLENVHSERQNIAAGCNSLAPELT